MLNYQRVIYYDQMDAHASTDTKSQQDAGVLRHTTKPQPTTTTEWTGQGPSQHAGTPGCKWQDWFLPSGDLT